MYKQPLGYDGIYYYVINMLSVKFKAIKWYTQFNYE